MKRIGTFLKAIFVCFCLVLLHAFPVQAMELHDWSWSLPSGDAFGMEKGNSWTAFCYPDLPEFPDGTETLLLQTELPKNEIEQGALLFTTTNQSFRIWLNGSIVYQYGSMTVPEYGQHTHLVVLGKDYAGKLLQIETFSSNPYFLGDFSRMELDTLGNQTQRIARMNFPLLLSIPITIYMLFLLVEYSRSTAAHKQLYRYLKIFLMVFFVWMVAGSPIRNVIDFPAVWWGIFRVSFYLLPFVGARALYEFVDKKYRQYVCFAIVPWLLLFLLALVMEIAGMHGFDRLLPVYYFLTVVFGGVAFYWTWKSDDMRARYGGTVFLPLLALLFFSFMDGIRSNFHWMESTNYWLPFHGTCFAVFVFSLVREQVQREQKLSMLASGLEVEVALAVERAEVDQLTKCYNRLRLNRVMESEMEKQQLRPVPFSLIMLDIDHFKRINDTYGHDAGDVVLTGFAAQIRHNIKKNDVFVRWGGEEFIVFCHACALEEAYVIAERLRATVEESHIFSEKTITCSVGVATWHGEDDTIAGVLKRVDNALYYAKEHGRNRVSTENDAEEMEEDDKKKDSSSGKSS